MEIRGRKALITGGCGAIGLAMARLFLDYGTDVVLVDQKTGEGEKLAANSAKVTVINCDMTDAAAIEAKLGPVFGAADAPDILLNNVGASPKYHPDGSRLKTWTMTLEQWNSLMTLNVTSYFLCTKLALPGMMERRRGRIINTASYAARTGGYQPACHYVASKAAVLGLTKSVAKEVSSFGITVNAINPGRIDTPMTRDVPDEVNLAFLKTIPAGRFGLPEDIAKAAVFLASDLADYVTGTAIEVNGGIYMGP